MYLFEGLMRFVVYGFIGVWVGLLISIFTGCAPVYECRKEYWQGRECSGDFCIDYTDFDNFKLICEPQRKK